MSMKNSNDTIGNRTRDLPTCSAVPQPTALRRAPELDKCVAKFYLLEMLSKKHFMWLEHVTSHSLTTRQ